MRKQDHFSLVPHLLPSLINNCFSLPLGTQGRSWRLNEGCFLVVQEMGDTKTVCWEVPQGPADISNDGDIPGGPLAKTLFSQCKGPRFNSWSGNYIHIPHATTKILYVATKTQWNQISKYIFNLIMFGMSVVIRVITKKELYSGPGVLVGRSAIGLLKCLPWMHGQLNTNLRSNSFSRNREQNSPEKGTVRVGSWRHDGQPVWRAGIWKQREQGWGQMWEESKGRRRWWGLRGRQMMYLCKHL